jgi:hypothetical protein
MPTLYITEFAGIQSSPYEGTMNCAATPSLADQAIAFTGTSAQSATLNAATRLIRVVSDANCFKKIGTNPTATQTTVRLVADSVEYFSVPPNSGFKVAVVASA